MSEAKPPGELTLGPTTTPAVALEDRLLHGLDESAETLSRREQIERFHAAHRVRCPWLDMVGPEPA